MKKVHAIGLFGVILLLQSCGSNQTVSNRMIQKRKYTKGFHIAKRGKLHGNSDKHKADEYAYQNDMQKNQKTAEALFPQKPRLLSGLREVPGLDVHEANINESQNPILIQRERIEDDKCDIIMLKNGDEISAKVTEIGTSEIKYKQCDNQEGPTYTLQKNDIFKIKYANGTSELISQIEKTTNPTANGNTSAANNKAIRGMSIASIILSIAGIPMTLFLGFGFIFSTIAFLLALTALIMHLVKPREERNAKAGKLSYIAMGVSVLAPILGLIIILILL